MSPADFSKYPRDLTGYGRDPPDPRWPGGARIAVQFVVNYEEGGEHNVLHGDATSEAFLSDVLGATPWPGARHMNVESMYEYGSRAGFWRLWRAVTPPDVPVTVFGVASALARSPETVAAMREARWEIASHGLKWIDYKDVPEEEERAHLVEAIRVHTQATGERPLGWYTGRTSVNTLKAVLDEGGFLYSSDSYADDLPYWVNGPKGPHLIIRYTLDANDMRFINAQGFGSGDEFFAYLKDAFDLLYAEGERAPKMMSIGLHCRLVGRPGRAAALTRFLDYVGERERVWLATRLDIAALAPRASFTRRCRPGDPVAPHDEDCARKPECGGRGRLHGRGGRCVRARAVGGASAAQAGAVRPVCRPARGDDGGGAPPPAGPTAGIDQRPSRPRGQGGARRHYDGGFQGGTGERGPRPPLGGGICAIPSPQQRLPREVRHAVHHLRAAARQGFDPAAVRTSPAKYDGGGNRNGAWRDLSHCRASPRPTPRSRRSPRGARPPVDPCARHPGRTSCPWSGDRASRSIRQ